MALNTLGNMALCSIRVKCAVCALQKVHRNEVRVVGWNLVCIMDLTLQKEYLVLGF